MSITKKNKTWFKNCLENKELIKKLKKIKLLITDVDGCLTNGNISMINPTGEVAKSFSVIDGFAIDRIIKTSNLLIAFLSGRKDIVTKVRAQKVGIPDDMCFIGDDARIDKKIKIKLIQEKRNILREETLLFGDDFLDIEAKSTAAIFACPKNTPFYFQEQADLIIPLKGGQHTFRLLLDLVLYVQNKHFAQKYIEESLRR